MSDYYPDNQYPLVVCRRCKKSYHRINDNYDPAVHARGHMFTILPRYKHWSTFTPVRSTIGDRLVCPGCGAKLADKTGKVVLSGKLPPPIPKPEVIETFDDAVPLHFPEEISVTIEEMKPEQETVNKKDKKKKREHGNSGLLGEILS